MSETRKDLLFLNTIDTISDHAAHGNSLKQTNLFSRTQSSAIKEFESKAEKEQAHKDYKDEIPKQTEGDEILSRHRNIKQLQNLRSKVTGQAILSTDVILNTHTIIYEEPNFVRKLTTVQDLVVIFGMEDMSDELKQLLSKQNLNQMGRAKRIWYLSPMRAAKVQASLRIRAVSPEPSLLAHTSSESRGTFRQKARSVAPLNGWACAVEICHDGMLEDINSLGGAQMLLCHNILFGRIFCVTTFVPAYNVQGKLSHASSFHVS